MVMQKEKEQYFARVLSLYQYMLNTVVILFSRMKIHLYMNGLNILFSI